MADTQFFSPASRSAPSSSVRSPSRDNFSVQITKAPEREERSTERPQNSRSNRPQRSENSARSERVDRQAEQAVVRGEVVAVSDDGVVQVRTPEGDYELQLTDLRVVRRLQAELAQRTVQIDIVLPPSSDQAQTARYADIVIVPAETDRAAQSQYRSPPLDTPVQIQISGEAAPSPSVSENTALVPLQVLVEGGLPDQPLRLEAVSVQDVALYLTPPTQSLDVVAQIVDVQSAPVVNPSPALASVVIDGALLTPPVLEVVLNTPSVQIVPLVVVAEGDDALTAPIPIPDSLVSPQLAASVIDVAAAQNGITVLPDAAAVQSLQATPIRINVPQNFSQVVEGAANAVPAAEALILNNVSAVTTQAVIVGKTPENLPVLAVNNAGAAAGEPLYFVLHYPVGEIVPGTEISFTPVSGGSSEGSAAIVTGVPQASVPLPFGFLTPEVWPAMTSALQSLQQGAPAIAQAMANITPSASTPTQMTPAAMFFMAAIGGGDLSNWLGQKHIETLRRAGQSGMVERLSVDMQGLSRVAGEPASQDWRVMMLPLLWENEIHKAIIHYKRDDGDSDGENAQGKQTRFVLDLDLDAMGSVQVDALFKPGRLDTIVRTQERFSEAMHQEMRRMYTDALKMTETGGELSFQNDAEQWVKILPKSRDVGVRV